MPTYDIQFVDSIAATPTVRLDLGGPGWTVRDGTEFGVPELRRSTVSTLLADGDQYPAAAYGNRTLSLVVRVDGASDDAIAAQAQLLIRELDRPRNILRYRPGTSAPVFFRTYRAGPDNVQWDPFTKEVRAQIPAEPFALGLREALPAVTVYADPATPGADLNSNPYFETDASGWGAMDGTVARSTAQFHQGVASLLLTPDGVGPNPRAESGFAPVAQGLTYRVSAWVRCAVARSVELHIQWLNAGGGLVSTSGGGTSVAATTWTRLEASATPPAGATQAGIRVRMTGTPPISSTLHIDEAQLRLEGAGNGMYVDLTGIEGDVEAPLYLSVPGTGLVTSAPDSSRTAAVAVRRRGTPSAAPFVLQAEAMSMGADTTVQANSTAMSGGGSNWTRTTFATTPTMQDRLSIATWPAVASVDVRGQYRVYMRYRQSLVSGLFMQARLLWGTGNAYITNDTATLVQFDYAAAGSPRMKYADLGIVQFPQGYDPVADGPDGVELPAEGMSFVVQASCVSSGSSLDVDLLLFVPVDDRMLLVTWPASPTLPVTLTLDSDKGQVYTEGTAGVLGRTGAQLAGAPPMVSPGVTNRVYFVRDVGTASSTGPGAQGDEITASTTITPYYWPRYLYARPASS